MRPFCFSAAGCQQLLSLNPSANSTTCTVHHPAASSAAQIEGYCAQAPEETIMKWEPNIVGYPIRAWQKITAAPTTEGVAVDDTKSVTLRPSDNDNIVLSDNIMLAHYQRDRR